MGTEPPSPHSPPPNSLPLGGSALAPVALSSLHLSPEPQLGLSTLQLIHHAGLLHVQLRTEHQIKKAWSLLASLTCAVTVTSILNTVEK